MAKCSRCGCEGTTDLWLRTLTPDSRTGGHAYIEHCILAVAMETRDLLKAMQP